MNTLLLERPLAWSLVESPEPPPPGPGQALVRVHQVGLCGTDYAGYLGKMPFFSYPRIPGHELGVEILAVGPDVTHLQPGQRCAVEPYINCQQCYPCRTGHPNCCEHHQTLGVHCDGGLRPRFLVPARKLHPSTALSFEQLALVETLAIGAHAVHRAQPQPHHNVLIIGAGPIGLATLEFVRLSGARPLVLDLSASRLAFVQNQLGVPHALLAHHDDSDLAQVADLTQGQLADVVIDATGNARSMSTAMKYCAFAGRLVYVGITQQELSFPHAPLVHRRELTLLASRNALASDFTHIIQLIEQNRLDTKPWISHRVPFHQLIQTFPSYLEPEAKVIKALVDLSRA